MSNDKKTHVTKEIRERVEKSVTPQTEHRPDPKSTTQPLTVGTGDNKEPGKPKT